MYKVIINRIVALDPSTERNILADGVLTKKINCADSFSFKVNDPNVSIYNLNDPMRSQVTVYRDGVCIFSGRTLSIERDFYNARTVLCESDMAFLNDSILRPYSFSGTVSDYLQMLITQHNSQVESHQQFTLGQVDMSDTIVRRTSEYKTTWAELFEKTVGSDLGGYLYVQPGTRILNYYEDSPFESSQVLRVGENIIDYSETRKADKFGTSVIPLGAEDDVTGERLTIASVNNGLDYFDSSVNVGRYGHIYKTVIFDDITNANILMSRGVNYLRNQIIRMPRSIKLTAIDLGIFDQTIDDLDFFDYVTVEDPYHNVNGKYLITERKYNISAPEKDSITLEIEEIES